MKKSVVLFSALLALAIVIEARVQVAGISPNLTVLFAYYVGLRHGPRSGLLSGAALGVVADSLAGSVIGPNLLGKSTAGYLAPLLNRGFFTWTPVLGLLGVFVLTACDGIISYASMSLFFRPPASMSSAAVTILWQAALNSLFGVFIRPEDED